MMNTDDQLAVLQCVAAMGAFADARDWNSLVGLFSETVRVDYSSLFGGEAEELSADTLMARWRGLLPGFSRTQHTVGIPMLRLEGDVIVADAPFVAWHFIDSSDTQRPWIVGGRYEWRLQVAHGNASIRALTLKSGWQDGDTSLVQLAALQAKRKR